MNQPVRTFRLSDEAGAGLSCDETGLFLAGTPMLERSAALGWRPRPLETLNGAASEAYGLPIDFAAKLAGLRTVAGALNRGELVLARIAALQLRLPDPPPLAKLGNDETLIELAYRLQASGLLAKEFDEAKHPRWPAGTPDSQGGRFAPAGAPGSPQAAGSAAPKKPGHHAAEPQASPLATSLQRTPRNLSPQDKTLLQTLEAKLKDPANQGIVWFDNRNDALKDMGYFFSADITRFDDPGQQYERGAWLFRDPSTSRWFYDRSQMLVGFDSKHPGVDNVVGLALTTPNQLEAYKDGNAINVHIHPLIARTKPFADTNNQANESFSPPGHDFAGDPGKFASISASSGVALHAAVIGSDGSISYAERRTEGDGL